MSGKIPECSNNRRRSRQKTAGSMSRDRGVIWDKILETGTEPDHAHFLVQPVPVYSPEQTVAAIKSITAKKIFESCPGVKEMLWDENFGLGKH
jgi:REP element-mobilizing transposase RayT